MNFITNKKRYMGQISGLKNTIPETKQCKFFNAWSNVREILSSDMVATTAQDNGAIDVYRDDNKKIQIRAHRRLSTIYEDEFSSLAKAKPAVIEWMGKIL